MDRIINIFANDDSYSKEVKSLLQQKLQKSGFVVPKQFNPGAELIISIGGDGALLRTLHKYEFPDIPFLGINTGHLGFFEELYPKDLDEFIFMYKQGRYSIQDLKTVKASVYEGNGIKEYQGLNEILIKSYRSSLVHLNISIGESFIERFSGDGILVCTPSGSTAYNYSLGGSIVDPRLTILQVTPIAPMNTTAYRSFTSSLVLPKELRLRIHPECQEQGNLMIVVDGMEYMHSRINEIDLGFSDTVVKLLRFEHYDFWNKVKSKFL